MDGITASILFVLGLVGFTYLIRIIADKLYVKWNPDEDNGSNDDSYTPQDNYSAPQQEANDRIDSATLAVISAAAASVLKNRNIFVKKVTFVRNRPNNWADSGRLNIMSSHQTR